MSNKVVKLECLVQQTLVKDSSGRKIRVKEGDTFQTDSRTAETYLRVYKKHFKLAETEARDIDAEGVISLQNRVEELEKENKELTEKNEKLEDEIVDIQIENIRDKYEGKELKDIPYNDLRRIATLQGIEFDKTPKGEDLIKALEEHEAGQADK